MQGSSGGHVVDLEQARRRLNRRVPSRRELVRVRRRLEALVRLGDPRLPELAHVVGLRRHPFG